MDYRTPVLVGIILGILAIAFLNYYYSIHQFHDDFIPYAIRQHCTNTNCTIPNTYKYEP